MEKVTLKMEVERIEASGDDVQIVARSRGKCGSLSFFIPKRRASEFTVTGEIQVEVIACTG